MCWLLELEEERRTLANIETIVSSVQFMLIANKVKRLLMMIIALWSIRNERNDIRVEGRVYSAKTMAGGINSYASEMSSLLLGEKHYQARRKLKWSKPPLGTLKLSSDASFIPGSMTGSWGFLIRDNDGDVVIIGRRKVDHHHLLNPFHAELIACLQGMQVAVNMGIGHLILEIDVQEVVLAFNMESYSDSVAGHLVDEMKFIGTLSFLIFVYVHSNRDCNQAAHELASLGHLCIEVRESGSQV